MEKIEEKNELVGQSKTIAIKTNGVQKIISKTQNIKDFAKLIPRLTTYIDKIPTGVTDENKKQIEDLGKNLNKLKGEIEEKRKEWYKAETKDITKIKDSLMDFEKALGKKRGILLESYKKNEEKRVLTRLLYFENYYKEIKEAYDLFDFITFDKYIKEDFMTKETAFGTKGDLKKSSKEKVKEKLEKFARDKQAIGSDAVALAQYKANGFDVAFAISFSKEQRELIEKEKEQELEAERIRKEKAAQEANAKQTTTPQQAKVVVKEKVVTNNPKNTITFSVEVPISKADAFENNLKNFKFKYEREQ